MAVSFPVPVSPTPWWKRDQAPAIFDADGKIVSFIENWEFIFACVEVHDGLRIALADMTAAYELTATLLGMPPEDIAHATALSRAILKRCEPKAATS